MDKRLIHPKVASSGGVGSAIGVLVAGILGRAVHLSPAEAGAIAVLCGYGATFLPARS